MFGQAELRGESSRHAPHLVQAAEFDGGNDRHRRELKTAGRLLDDRSYHGREQGRIIPGGDEGCDFADVTSHLTQRLDHSVDR